MGVQCGPFEDSAFEDILGEKEEFFKPALAVFTECGVAGGEEARAHSLPNSSWRLTSARSPETSHLKAPLQLLLCLPWEAAGKLPRSRDLGGYDLGIAPFLGGLGNGCWGETLCTV